MKTYTTKQGLQLRNWKAAFQLAVTGNKAAQEALIIYADSYTVGVAGSLDCKLNRSPAGELADIGLQLLIESITELISMGNYCGALMQLNCLYAAAADVLEQEEEDRIQLRSEIYERSQARNSALRRSDSWA